ncbi:MAG: MBL fold metallo-hydrolase [Thermotogae bacterium]|nr:MBL fold metallo-hydrolase [Thermotogota bacterium]
MRPFEFGSEDYGNVRILGAPYSYVYLAGDILMDTGTGFWGKRIARFLEENSLKVSRILFTHSHYDHVGGYPYLGGIPTGAHPHLYGTLAKEKVARFIEEMNRREMAMLNDPDAQNYRFTPPEDGRPLEDGERLEWRGGEIEVIYTPGHTRDSVSYYILPEKVMVVGEAAGVPNRDGSFILPQFLSSIMDYLNSLRRLRGYEIEVLGLPHEMVIYGRRKVKDYLRLSEAATLRYVEDLKDIYARCGGEWDCIEREVMERIYRRHALDQPEYAFLANLKAQIRAVEREFFLPPYNRLHD